MKRIFYTLLFIIALGAVLMSAVGCGDANTMNDESFATVTDQLGREVIIPSVPERVISLSPSNTEIAYAVGLGDSIVGVTDYCNYPEEALAKDKIGGFSSPNIEKIVILEPDLVLAGNKHEELIVKFEEMGIPVIMLVPESIEDAFEAMELVAEATGKSEEAGDVISGIKNRLETVQVKVASVTDKDRVRIYYEVYSDPLMTAGGASLINEVISAAGGKNIFADVNESYPKISSEVLIERDPQVIIFPDTHGSEAFGTDLLKDRPLWSEITAVKENALFKISSDAISRPGPRLIDAVEDLAAIFYPELFK